MNCYHFNQVLCIDKVKVHNSNENMSRMEMHGVEMEMEINLCTHIYSTRFLLLISRPRHQLLRYIRCIEGKEEK